MSSPPRTAVADAAVAAVTGQISLRPQGVLLILFGDYLAEPALPVAASSIIDILGGVAVGEYAARATLSRMVRRGLLSRTVHGRRAYFGLTDHGRRTILGGRSRVQAGGLVGARWDGRWTLVGFSMPQAWQHERHDVRARLVWAGFGMIQSGLWVCPRRVDVPAVLDGLGLDGYVRVFDAVPVAPTEAARLVADAYDLDALAGRYAGFVQRWERFAEPPADPAAFDPLPRRIVLAADWLQVIREDPRLPLTFLPEGWPAVPAQALFHRTSRALEREAERSVRRRLQLLPG